MSRIAARRMSLISQPGCAEIPYTIHSTPPPQNIVEFLALCLYDYENSLRGQLMIIEYDKEDVLAEGLTEVRSMEALAKRANQLFHEKTYGHNAPERKNYYPIPQVKVKTRFVSKDDQITDQKLVFTIQTEYPYEPNFDDITDGTYFVPSHFKFELKV